VHKFFLLLLTLSPTDGQPTKVEVLDSFDDPKDCVQAAIDKGPQQATADGVPVFVCARERGVI
jgi:hypothetical protein